MGLLTKPLAGDPPPAPSRGLRGALGTRVHVPVVVRAGGVEIPGRMRLLGRAEALEVKRDTFAALAKFPVETWHHTGLAREDWNAELAIRYLAVAVRDPADLDKPLDELDVWRKLLDDEQIAALSNEYEDLRIAQDQSAAPIALTPAEIDTLEAALKKKDPDILMSFGLRKLVTFTLSLADRLPTSPTEK